jgi:hypothetical protein
VVDKQETKIRSIKGSAESLKWIIFKLSLLLILFLLGGFSFDTQGLIWGGNTRGNLTIISQMNLKKIIRLKTTLNYSCRSVCLECVLRRW